MGHRREQVPQREVLIKTPPKGAGFQLAPAVCSLVDVMKRVNYLEPEKPLATKGQAQKRNSTYCNGSHDTPFGKFLQIFTDHDP
ncbi:hypothetical protein AVEN_201532-1 [Araneus ventricosus]|uniref:Uncharacterized protein n=1 Tax=Araneus ventricosus TaxID=182803 RepID=A0A4Y2SJV4_ARAVE|nr:hypothetical protein AVEN_201532-1 [Araneus ventricosus]